MPAFVNIGGVWKQITSWWVNVGGTDKKVTSGWVNIGGVWKKFFAADPQVTVASATITSVGTAIGSVCDEPYVFRVNFSIQNQAAGYVVDIDMATDVDGVGYSSWKTNLLLTDSPQTEEVEGVFRTGTTNFNMWRRYRVKVRRLSDNAIVSQLETNQLEEEVDSCLV